MEIGKKIKVVRAVPKPDFVTPPKETKAAPKPEKVLVPA